MASAKTSLARAIEAIDRHGVLLVYPLQNRPEPLSLWHVFHPRTPMRWAWDEGADRRVVDMWHLRERLARDRRVVYTKWLGGRATFFSRDLFRAMLSTLRDGRDLGAGVSPDATTLLELLQDDSPQSTRALRESAGLGGRAYEAAFTRAMRELWERLLIVGVGEVEAGGFPALAVGATELLREDLWTAAEEALGEAERAPLERALDQAPSFARAWRRTTARIGRLPLDPR
jgi:hypothetical protein